MKELHTNFKIIRCGIFINEEYPWLRTTPDFLCSCDCEEGCGEVKYPFCIEVTSIILWRRALSYLKKDSSGNFNLKTQHQYYYQAQQQIFTSKKRYCDFVVCSFNDMKETKLVVQRICPDTDHWKADLRKVTNFWKTCVLPEVLGMWYTRKHSTPKVDHPSNNDVWFCRTATGEDTVICCNPECLIGNFHLSCLQIVSLLKTWYGPNCRTLPKFRQKGKFA